MMPMSLGLGLGLCHRLVLLAIGVAIITDASDAITTDGGDAITTG